MDNSLKAALWSGLVFPGMGQIVLKRYKRGIGLILAVLIGLAFIVVQTVQQALALLGKIDLESGPVDVGTVSDLVTQASTAFSDNLMFHFAMWLIILAWIIGVCDAYIVGMKMDKEKRSGKAEVV